MRPSIPLLVVVMSCVASAALAEDKLDIDALRAEGYSVSVISPIFSQLVKFSLPKGFTTVFEDSNGKQYTREAVLNGETVERWSQMVTVTGAKGLSATPKLTPQSFLERIASGFESACPDSFSAKSLGATKISGRDAFMALAGCGTVSSGGDSHSEAALLIAVKGAADYYTIQWAERGPASAKPMAFSDATWTERLDRLSPIKLCPVLPREAPLYPSCINQK
jgi:hypothetical protein